jgi:hypothetical protein
MFAFAYVTCLVDHMEFFKKNNVQTSFSNSCIMFSACIVIIFKLYLEPEQLIIKLLFYFFIIGSCRATVLISITDLETTHRVTT